MKSPELFAYTWLCECNYINDIVVTIVVVVTVAVTTTTMTIVMYIQYCAISDRFITSRD